MGWRRLVRESFAMKISLDLHLRDGEDLPEGKASASKDIRTGCVA